MVMKWRKTGPHLRFWKDVFRPQVRGKLPENWLFSSMRVVRLGKESSAPHDSGRDPDKELFDKIRAFKDGKASGDAHSDGSEPLSHKDAFFSVSITEVRVYSAKHPC
jgi:hypothetical protein